MRYIQIFLFVFLISISGAARFRILSIDREKVEIRFTTATEPKQASAPGGPGAEVFFAPDADGHVVDSSGRVLPSFSLRIAVPGSGAPRILVLTLEKDTFALESFSPDTATASQLDTSVCSAPAGWLSTPKYETLGGIRTALYTLSPVAIDIDANRITIVRDASFRISYPRKTDETSTVSLIDRSLLKASVLNGESFFPSDTNQGSTVTGSSLPQQTILAFSVGTHTPSEGSHVLTSQLIRLPVDRILAEYGGELSTDAISLHAAPRFGFNSEAKPDSSAPKGFSSVPIILEDIDQNGFLDHEDEVTAYVRSSSGWWYDSTDQTFRFRKNPNTGKRPYVLVLGSEARALTMGICPQPSAADTEITTFPALRRYRDFSIAQKYDNRIVLSTLDPEVSTTIAYPHADYDHPEASLRLITSSKHTAGINIFWAQNAILAEPLLPFYWTDIPLGVRSPAPVGFETTFPDSAGALRIDAVEIRYNQHLDMEGMTELEIFPPKGNGVFAYTVRNLPEEPCYVLRVPENDADICLIDRVPTIISTYSWYDSAAADVRYLIIAESAVDTIDFTVE